MKKIRALAILIMFLMIFPSSCLAVKDELPSLKDIYEEYFPIGTAVSVASWANPKTLYTHDSLIEKHFNSLTVENAMKPDYLQPREGHFNFRQGNEVVDFAESKNMLVRGHTLVWHAQTPDWFFKDNEGRRIDEKEEITESDRQLVIGRMEAHIERVVSEYKGRIYAWDVVNEAISDSPNEIYRQDSPWYKILGEDFIKLAFIKAHEVDPDAKLFYNDYGAVNPNKRDRIIKMLEGLIAEGVPVHGIGIQGHWSVEGPSFEDIERAIQMYADLGLEIHITELDVGMKGYTEEEQAQYYREIFKIFKKYSDVITNVTFWGMTDNTSWRADENPLLFDKNQEPKPAFWAIVNTDNPWYVNKAECIGALTFRNSAGKELVTLLPGKYTLNDINSVFSLEEVARLELQKGYVAIFYESEDFTGDTYTYISTDEFDGLDMLNKVKGVNIKHVEFNNILLGKTAEANVAADRAERAIDGNSNSSWSPNAQAPYWLTVDLEETYLINRWVVKLHGTGPLAGANPDGPFNAADYKLQVSTDGVNWYDIDTVTGNTASFTDRNIKSTEARYVRLYVTRPTSLDFNQKLVVYEFEVYGIPLTNIF